MGRVIRFAIVMAVAALVLALPARGTRQAQAAPGDKLSYKLGLLLGGGSPGNPAVVSTGNVPIPAGQPGSITTMPNGDLLVYVTVTDTSPATQNAITNAHATIINVSPVYHVITVSINLANLPALENVGTVSFIREVLAPMVNRMDPPSGPRQSPAITCNSVISEGDAQLHADTARSTYGLDGSGVSVGVISDSYNASTGASKTAAQDVLTDDLPGTGNTCGHTTPVNVLADLTPGPNPTDEGRAMLQNRARPGARLQPAVRDRKPGRVRHGIAHHSAAGIRRQRHLGRPHLLR